jgi:hypothetical protein
MFSYVCPNCGASAFSLANTATRACPRCAGPLGSRAAMTIATRPVRRGAAPPGAAGSRDARRKRQRIARGEAGLLRAVAAAGVARHAPSRPGPSAASAAEGSDRV